MLTIIPSMRSEVSSSSDGKLVNLASVIARNEDLLREILIRLPVRSLLQFKSVSKRWLSLLTDPLFIRNYNRRSPLTVSGIYLQQFAYFGEPEYRFISLDNTRNLKPFKSLTFIDDTGCIKILHSCNGLLCCRSIRGEKYYIYNPTIKHYTILPSPSHRGEYYVYSLSLAFDPLESADYKIVCIHGTSMGQFQLTIYASNAPYWRTSGDAFTSRSLEYQNSGVYWNGALHWVMSHDSSLCFHVNREVFQKMPMPPLLAGQDGGSRYQYVKHEYVGASREHLYLVLRHNYSSQLNILELETDYSQWNLKYCIDLVAMTLVYPDMVTSPAFPTDDPEYDLDWKDYDFRVLLVQGEPDVPSMVLQISHKIILFNMKEETFVELQGLLPLASLIYSWSEAHKHIESFVALTQPQTRTRTHTRKRTRSQRRRRVFP